jgi:hypothetical protein
MCFSERREVFPHLACFCGPCAALRLVSCHARSSMSSVLSKGGRVLRNHVLSSASRSNSALVSDACAAALRAFYSAPQRGR